MKLSTIAVQNLYDLFTTCAVADIDQLLIDEGWARGVNEERSCLIISDFQVPAFGGAKCGLTRLSELRRRFELFMLGGKFEEGFSVEAAISERAAEVARLNLALGKDRLEWRCAPASMVPAPKSVNDEPACIISVNRRQLALMLNGLRLAASSKLTLSVRPDGTATFQVVAASDNLIITNDTPAELVTELEQSMVHHYLPKVLSSILRVVGDEASLAVGVGGTITTIVRGHPLILLPQIGDNE